MRKKKFHAGLGQALIYLTLLVITPFICMTFVRAADMSESVVVPQTEAAAPVTQTVPVMAEFKIITDDSFFESSGGLHMPSAGNEDGDFLPFDSGDSGSSGSSIPSEKLDDNSADEFADNSADEFAGVVEVVTYGQMEGSSYINLDFGQIRNMTDHDNADIMEIASQPPAVNFARDGSPEILIYHTHATESYLLDASEKYDTDFPFRSTDKSINMVSVGKAIADELRAAGYGVIHDETLFDEESYNGAYELSRAAVKKHLDENPGIKLVLDVHRDALVRSETEIAAPTVKIGGKDAAQIMVVSNCDSKSLKYPIPLYRENLKMAAVISEASGKKYDGLMRPLLFDYRQYNQDLSTGALLIEVGGHGNSISQALYSGELFGKALVKTLGEL
jgi:stage II sporulation protein P